MRLDPQSWDQVERIFQAALDKDEEQRTAFVRERCKGDEALAQVVAEMLSAHDGDETLDRDRVTFGLAQDSPELSVGQQLGSYRLLAVLGRGGMGEVYRAFDTRLEREVALKILPTDSADPERVSRLEREAKALAVIQHPGVVTVHSVEEADGVHFLTMELLEGKTLADVLTQNGNGLPRERFFPLALQLCHALGAAHSSGIVHRDIKPSNILISSSDQVSLIDFGLVKRPRQNDQQSHIDTATETQAGRVMGTWQYMSPEQARGEPVGTPSDVFSLGVVLYEMLSSQRPFDRPSQAETVASILHEPAPKLESLRPELPQQLVAVIHRCLEKDAQERFTNARDVATALEGASSRDEAATSEGQPTSPTARPISRREERAARRLQLAAAVIAVMAITGALWLWPRAAEIFSSEAPEAGAAEAIPDALVGELNPLSIAVLPFDNLSPDPDNAFFADGMTEEMISRLSQIGALTVVSRTSVMRYRDTQKSVRQIAEELNVARILEGSVRRAGGQVRITGQLIDASTDRQLWSDSYTHELADVFAVQSEVASHIADALKLELSPSQRETLTRPPTQNATAYDFYLRGMQYIKRFREDDNEFAIDMFERALEEDPGFALAYAGLAGAYSQRWQRFGGDRQQAHELSLAAAESAVQLNPNLAEAYQALANALFAGGREEESCEALEMAVELKPSYRTAVANLGIICAAYRHRWFEALGRLKQAVQLDPLDAHLATYVGYLLTDVDLHAAAQPWFDRALELEPDGLPGLAYPAYSHLFAGEADKALALANRILEISPEETIGLWIAATAHWQNGNFAEAKRLAERAPGGPSEFLGTPAAHIAWSEGRQNVARRLLQPRLDWLEGARDLALVDYLKVAEAYAIQGNEEEAYRYLDQAMDDGLARDGQLRYYPSFEGMREQERFRRILEQIGERIARQRRQIEATEALLVGA